MKQKTKKSIKLFIYIVLILLVILYIVLFISKLYMQNTSHFIPDYEMIDLNKILEKEVLEEVDYENLFYQTGLGKVAIDALLQDKSTGKNKIIEIQKYFFNPVNIKSDMITPITFQESLVSDDNNYIYGTELPYYKNGYIMVTSATYSFWWRHGHAAIIIDDVNGYTLESAVLGQNSQIMNIKKWLKYPNFILFKLKNATNEQLDEIANYANKNLSSVPYRLTSGIFSSKYKANVEPVGTHCSHLVWYSFMVYGYDLDSDGGKIVTPKDLANSDLLEVVQVYGFDPRELWK